MSDDVRPHHRIVEDFSAVDFAARGPAHAPVSESSMATSILEPSLTLFGTAQTVTNRDDFEGCPAGNWSPLALTDFEWLMWCDDHRRYPRVFQLSAEFEGTFSRWAVAAAIPRVLDRHPLLSAIVKRNPEGWQWVPTSFPAEGLLWVDDAATAEAPTFDLRQSPGFRVFVSAQNGRSVITFWYHHAVCDGISARRILADFGASYGRLVDPQSTIRPPKRLDPHRLAERGRSRRILPTPKPSEATEQPLSVWEKIKTATEFLRLWPVPVRGRMLVTTLDSPRAPASTPISDPASSSSQPEPIAVRQPSRRRATSSLRPEPRALPSEDLDRIQSRLQGTRLQLHDVAAAVVLHTIASWNRQHGEAGRDRLYRLLIPVDLREVGDERLPAANKISFVFLTRPTSLCLDLDQLLGTVRAEMDYIDAHGCRHNLPQVLPAIRRLPGVLPLALRLPICYATAVLSYFGDVGRSIRSGFPRQDGRPVCGDVIFRHATGAPPLRPGTRLAFGMVITDGILRVSSHFDGQHFSAAAAELFLDQLMETWQAWGRAERN